VIARTRTRFGHLAIGLGNRWNPVFRPPATRR
jgi:hypothetical protein